MRNCDSCPFVQGQLAEIDTAQAAMQKLQAMAGGLRYFLDQEVEAINADVHTLGTVGDAIQFHSDPAMYSDEWISQVPKEVTEPYYEKLAMADMQIIAAMGNIDAAQTNCHEPLTLPTDMVGYIVVQCTSSLEVAQSAMSVRPAED